MDYKPKRSTVEEPELIHQAQPSKVRGVRRGAFAGGALLTAMGLAALAIMPPSIDGAAQVADPIPAVSPTPERPNPVSRSNIRLELPPSESPTPQESPSPQAQPTPSSTPEQTPTPSASPSAAASPAVEPSPTPTKAAPSTPTPSKAPLPKLGEAAGEMQVTSTVNIRRGPGTDFDTITAVKEGGKVAITDVKVDGWQQVKVNDEAGYVAAKYLTKVSAPKPTPTPTTKPSPKPSRAVAAPSKTPSATPSATKPALPKLGKSAGDRWATTGLNVRQGPGSSHKVIAKVSSGQKVQITDVKIDGWQQINRDGKPAYVSAKYLTSNAPTSRPTPTQETSKPTTGECSNASAQRIASSLTSRARAVLWETCARFPNVSNYHGIRSGGGSYHNSGRAIDVMISGSAGWEVANWARANASRLGISEVIYAQKIWTTQRSSEGWRSMSNRGSVSANHYDHVHISIP